MNVVFRREPIRACMDGPDAPIRERAYSAEQLADIARVDLVENRKRMRKINLCIAAYLLFITASSLLALYWTSPMVREFLHVLRNQP